MPRVLVSVSAWVAAGMVVAACRATRGDAAAAAVVALLTASLLAMLAGGLARAWRVAPRRQVRGRPIAGSDSAP